MRCVAFRCVPLRCVAVRSLALCGKDDTATCRTMPQRNASSVNEPRKEDPTRTAATYETTAVRDRREDLPSRSGHRSRLEEGLLPRRRNFCAKIHRRRALRSFLMASGRCRGHTCWTGRRCGAWKNLLRYLSSQTRALSNWIAQIVRRTYGIWRSTSCWCCYATASRTAAAHGGRCLSADWAVRCRASSYR